MPNPIINRRIGSPKLPNGLLNGLISYWKFDVNVSPYADSIGTNSLTGSSTSAGIVAGIINGGLDVGTGSSQASIASNSDVMPAAGVSLSVSHWVKCSDWSGGSGSFPNWFRKGDNATLNSYAVGVVHASGVVFIQIVDSNSNFVTVETAGPLAINTFHHIVLSFDAPNLLLSGYVNGVLVGTAPSATNAIKNGAQPFLFGPGAGFAAFSNMVIDEAGLWHKSLTQTDVANLYNGGAALPLSAFTN